MRSKTLTAAATIALAGALLLTACGGDSGDDAVAGSGGDQPTVDTAAAVDLTALDTGDYPTEPRDKPFKTTAENINSVEAQRLAEYTVLPFEVDPDLTDTTMSQVTVVTAGTTGGVDKVLNDSAEKIPHEFDRVLYGFHTQASKLKENNQSPLELVRLASLRFPDNASANAAAEALEQFWTENYSRTSGKIDVLPKTIVSTKGPQSMASMTVHNDFLIFTWLMGAPDGLDWLTTTTAKLVAEQSKMLDKFPAADLNDPSTWPEMDQNNIMKYAMDTQSGGMGYNGIYSPRGIAHTALHPKLSFDLLTEAGSQYNAGGGSEVYRAKDNIGAESIFEGLTDAHRSIDGFTEESVPQGLEDTDTLCQTHPLKAGTYCLTVVGRYVALWAAADPTEAHQHISAQYAILQQADQSAN